MYIPDMTDTYFGGSSYGGYEPSYEEIMQDEEEEKGERK